MATPVAHSLIGVGTYLALNDKIQIKNWKIILLYVLAANAADMDFSPGLLVGDVAAFHHRESHSLGFSVLFALIVGLWVRYAQKKKDFKKPLIISFFLYLTHIVIDFFTFDKNLPYGSKLFWPFSNKYFISPAPIFYEVLRENFSVLFGRHNLIGMAIELGIFLPIIFLVYFLKKIKMGQSVTKG